MQALPPHQWDSPLHFPRNDGCVGGPSNFNLSRVLIPLVYPPSCVLADAAAASVQDLQQQQQPGSTGGGRKQAGSSAGSKRPSPSSAAAIASSQQQQSREDVADSDDFRPCASGGGGAPAQLDAAKRQRCSDAAEAEASSDLDVDGAPGGAGGGAAGDEETEVEDTEAEAETEDAASLGGSLEDERRCGGGAGAARCCVECGATQTPQWREGPKGEPARAPPPHPAGHAIGWKRAKATLRPPS